MTRLDQALANVEAATEKALRLLVEACDEILAAHAGEPADEHSVVGKLWRARAALSEQQA